MNIIMQCGGMPFNGETIEHASLGGSETAAYYLARELAARGHRVTIFTNHPDEGEWEDVRYRYAGAVTEQTPLGDRYQQFATCTPHDVNISQRHPASFLIPVAAKIKLWWIHDLALYRHAKMVQDQAPSIDAVLTVSEFHKRQVEEVYGLDPRNVVAIGNAVDQELYSQEGTPVDLGEFANKSRKLVYSNRPERGLETLVKPGGIMERLSELSDDYHLFVCGYDNVTAPMRQYYEYLWQRCEDLPNVTNLGSLTKHQLSWLQQQADAQVYPSVFEETFCITAVEAAAARLPLYGSHVGALPEVTAGPKELEPGAVLLPLVERSFPRLNSKEAGYATLKVDEEAFVEKLHDDFRTGLINIRRGTQEKVAERHTWVSVADRLEVKISELFQESLRNPFSVAKELLRKSDIVLLDKYLQEHPHDSRLAQARREFLLCYQFYTRGTYEEHYRDYYQYEEDRGVTYGPENHDNNPRFEYISNLLSHVPSGGVVLDYGCAHGGYLINLAKRWPNLRFIGIDIARSNVEKGRAWAADEDLEDRVEFYVGKVEDGSLMVEGETTLPLLDAAIVAEVLEHVPDPTEIIDTLAQGLATNGFFITSTPFGPWEAIGYNDQWPWRAHLHHFERQDLAELFGHHPYYGLTVVTTAQIAWGEPVGSYVCRFGKPQGQSGKINYARKLRQLHPKQTVGAAMIVKDAHDTILRTLKSFVPQVDEVVIGIDRATQDKDGLLKIINDYLRKYPTKRVELIGIESPLDTGFDEARNAVCSRVLSDWIFWPDSDEVLQEPEMMGRYLQNNTFDSVAFVQHHLSVEPPGVLKTDYPAKLYRNHRGIQFYGRVHEHPETGVSKGAGKTIVATDLVIAHSGYTDEKTRRARFDRNLELLARDREDYPERILGKFLWLRDLAQMNQQEAEKVGFISADMIERSQIGVETFEELLEEATSRMLIDAIPYYSRCAQLVSLGFKFSAEIGGEKIEGYFASRDHLNKVVSKLIEERTRNHETIYA